MPGSPQRQERPGGGLILPGNAPRKLPPPGQANWPELADELPNVQPTIRNYRPPEGFMNEDGPDEDPAAGKTSDELISKLTSRSDYWFVLAKFFPRLYREGMEAAILEELIDLSPARQNIWVVAGNVYNSLKATGQLSKEELSYFHSEHYGPECLMELRFLDTERRVEGARYIAENQLGPSDSLLVGRAIKEHERRVDTNEGFSRHAGDCMAFKYYRDALETRNPDDIVRYVNTGMKYAVTDAAREKLQTAIPLPPDEDEGPMPDLLMARLTKEDVGTRIVPILGPYADIRAEEVCRAEVDVASEGPFNMFSVPSTSVRYVALPRYGFMISAKQPIALTIPDASAIPELLQATGSQSEKDAAKLKYQALLVVDLQAKKVETTNYYLVEKQGGVALAAGKHVQSPIGQVLMIMLPQRREALSADSFDV